MYTVLLLLFAYANGHLPEDQDHPDLDMTVFPPLKNMHLLGQPGSEAEFPWVARVVHSTKGLYPHICTAACVSPRLFLTAVRCLLRLRLIYTRVYYRNQFAIPARAFVLPSHPTKQRYDDIGIIVTKPYSPGGNKWPTLRLFAETNRTDPRFAWFNNLHLEENRDDYYIVGYACEKKNALNSRGPFDLMSLNIVIDMELCQKLTRWDEKSTDYYVPCYHTCTVIEHKHNYDTCHRYHGVEGGVVVNLETSTLIGVATWGASTTAHNLPVGFAVPNSQAFLRDFACAKRIRDDPREESEGHMYQNLCDDLMMDL